MIVYAESSAVLAWLLEQPRAGECIDIFSRASRVTCSVLTQFECERVVRRSVAIGSLGAQDEARCRSFLARVSANWPSTDVTPDVLARARRLFPKEPVRTLDALHLGTALLLRATIPDLTIATLDNRVAENASLLGFDVLPRPDRPGA